MPVKKQLTRLATLALSPLLLSFNPVQATPYQDNGTDDTLLDVTILAQVPQSEFAAMKSHVLKYRYNASLGKCVNAKWQQGYNKVDEDYLFAQTVNDKNGNKQLLNKDAECVDFSGLDFYQFNIQLGVNYLQLNGWNFKGAKLDQATIYFATLNNPQLEGAKLDNAGIGYITINDGTSDEFTRHFSVDSCQPQNQLINCSY